MFAPRIPVWILACLTLALGGPGAGHATGAGPVAGVMTLCLGGVIVTTAVDARGKPLETAPLCPDCISVALSGVAPWDAAAPDHGPLCVSRPAAVCDPAPHGAVLPPVRAPPLPLA